MFTGIVETVGEVAEVEERPGGRRIRVWSPPVVDGLAMGASVSVAGACLTAVEVGEGSFAVDVVPETLARTTLGGLGPGTRVNLERAMAAGGRFDGHVVQGHVDGTGRVVEPAGGGSGRLRIQPPPPLRRYLVEKGSVAVDGVSLTVAALAGDAFEVALIPHTLAHTTLGDLSAGDLVNLEVDILAKYVERLLDPSHRR